MRKLKSYEIRQMWLDFWKSKGHEVLPSASLVPVNDPTLLWINAGVAPLKKYFDGREVPSNKRLVNAQKAIRTNDIDNVGKTARHHTFFEMLGNFSIGDYFRKEALTWGYEILTSDKWFGFDVNNLYFTIYPDDEESFQIWVSLGVDPSHIVRLEDNFWEIGEGPCGPDSEIFYDRGEKYDKEHLGIKMLQEDIENDRYIEIWNIVFSQFNAKTGVPRNQYKELPSKNIDTGMGLERMACVMQEVETNYETDLFMPLIQEIERMTSVKYTGQMAFKVISDHIRSVTFAVSDGAMLSNEGRGYVLRRILRRAVRYGKVLGMNKPFMYNLVDYVVDNMKSFYPYLETTKEMVKKVIKLEEEKFLQTLEIGEKKLLDYIKSKDDYVISGDFAFLLYDTFGFPIELTIEVSEENNFTVDIDSFKVELEKQKQKARASHSEEQSMNAQNEDMLNFNEKSTFTGYDKLETKASVIGIFKDGNLSSNAKGKMMLVFDETVFYATSGGQNGDKGIVVYKDKEYQIDDSFKLPNMQHAVSIDLVDNEIELGDEVILKVDVDKRMKTCANHSGTHLLNEALRKVLGSHIKQQGSNVTDSFLRFDFNNFTLPNDEELLHIEALVNEEINKETPTNIIELPLNEAKKLGVQAVFGEKYGEVVRVVTIGFSKELCGGTHVKNTKDITKLVILGVESKGSGIFRIECITGNDEYLTERLKEVLATYDKDILDLQNKAQDILVNASKENLNVKYNDVTISPIKCSYQTILNRRNELSLLRESVKELDKEYNKLKKDKTIVPLTEYLNNVKEINNKKVIIAKTFDLEVSAVKDLADRLSDTLGDSIIFLANICKPKIIFVCKNKYQDLQAGMLVKKAATLTNGGGGGRNDFAQAGGKCLTSEDEIALDKALEEIAKIIGENK